MSATHYRLLGYTVTLVIHIVTFYDIVCRLRVTTVDPVIADFATLQARFITIWTFLMQIFYVSLGLSIDTATLVRGKCDTKILKFRETLFSSLVWPMSVFIPLLFWPLYLYDPALVFPPFIDKILSPANNHVLHTAILPIVLWELMFLPRTEKNHKKDFAILGVFMVAYLTVLIGSYLERGSWLYPILYEIYGTIYFPLFILANLSLVIFCYAIQWPLCKIESDSAKKLA